MLDVRSFVRSALFLAALALLAISGCVGAFHDGLPAWTPSAGKAEGSIGYHRLFWPGGGSSVWYLTPGVRCGLRQSYLVGDIGLNTVVMAGSGACGAILGPALGIGFQTRNFCFVVRPSAYMLGISSGGVRLTEHPFWQVALLAGNSAQSGSTHFSGGCRGSEIGAGPLFLVDHSVGSVNLRLEGSYILPYETYVYGPYSNGQLTVGLTVGGRAPTQHDD